MWLKDFAYSLWLFVLVLVIILGASIVYLKTIQTLKHLSIKTRLLWILLKLKIQSWYLKKTQSGQTEYNSSDWVGTQWIPSESLTESDLVQPSSEKPSCSPPKAKASKEGTGSRRSTKPKSKPKLKK